MGNVQAASSHKTLPVAEPVAVDATTQTARDIADGMHGATCLALGPIAFLGILTNTPNADKTFNAVCPSAPSQAGGVRVPGK